MFFAMGGKSTKPSSPLVTPAPQPVNNYPTSTTLVGSSTHHAQTGPPAVKPSFQRSQIEENRESCRRFISTELGRLSEHHLNDSIEVSNFCEQFRTLPWLDQANLIQRVIDVEDLILLRAVLPAINPENYQIMLKNASNNGKYFVVQTLISAGAKTDSLKVDDEVAQTMIDEANSNSIVESSLASSSDQPMLEDQSRVSTSPPVGQLLNFD